MHPDVAVVTRTRNRPLLLARALQTVARQTFRSIAHIVVNDAGEREPVDALVAELPPAVRERIVRIDNRVSSGREAAVNPGLARARQIGSAYTVVLDDDDSWAPDFLEKVVARLREHPEEVAAISAVNVVHETVDGGAVTEIRRVPLFSGLTRVALSELLVRNFVPPVCLVFRTEALDALGGWRADLPVLADWDFNLRLALMGPIGLVDELLANWHHRETTDADLGNSIVVAADEHRDYEGAIRDGYLRDAGLGRDAGQALAIPLLLGGYVARLSETIESTRTAQASHLELVKGLVQQALEEEGGKTIDELGRRLDGIERRQEELERHLLRIGRQNAAILGRLEDSGRTAGPLDPKRWVRRLRGGNRRG